MLRTTEAKAVEPINYLIHFKRPYKHARHYLGCTTDLEARLKAHRRGEGARLMAVVTQHDIPWEVAKTWAGGWAKEKQLKGFHSGVKLCPICRKERIYARFS